MANFKHPLEDFITQQDAQLSTAAAAKAAEERRAKDQRESLIASWSRIQVILKEAIIDINAVLSAKGRRDQFEYIPLPQPGHDIARGIIRIAEPMSPPKLEANLVVTDKAEILLTSTSYNANKHGFELSMATRSQWAEALTRLYMIVSARN